MALEFRKMHFPADPNSRRSVASTRYFAFNPEQDRDVAIVEVEHHQPESAIQTHEEGAIGIRHILRGQRDEWGYPEETQVPVLFRDYGHTQHNKLALMTSAPDHAATAMSLMGLAHQDSQASGVPLVPDKNLTKHSLRIVRHLAKLGMVNRKDVPRFANVDSHRVMHLTPWDNRHAMMSAMYDKDPATLGDVGMERIDSADVRSARNNLGRSMQFARQQKQSKKKQSMEGQPTLFD